MLSILSFFFVCAPFTFAFAIFLFFFFVACTCVFGAVCHISLSVCVVDHKQQCRFLLLLFFFFVCCLFATNV